MREAYGRYSTVSIMLHWTLVILLIANIRVGGWMEDAPQADRAFAFMVHKSLGAAVLLLSLIRLVWRLKHPWPALPNGTPKWENWLARFTHYGFYVLMIGVPLLGWAAISAFGAPEGPIFKVIPFPNLPLPESEALGKVLGGAHKLAVKAIYVLLALHVLGALKHHFWNRDAVLHRMLPLFPNPERNKRN